MDDIDPARKMLFAWLLKEPELYHSLKDVISANDFGEGLCSKAAELFFEQLKENALNPAKIISSFENEEEHRKIVELFASPVDSFESAAEKEKALEETVRKVKKKSLEEKAAKTDPSDIEGLQRMINQKKALERLHISL